MKRSDTISSILWAVIVLCFLVAADKAEAQQLRDTVGDWRVFTHQGGVTSWCYIASVPVKKTGNYTARGEPFLMVTRRRGGMEEVSVSSGYPYKAESQVSVTIDSRKYDLFTRDDRAWGYDAEQDGNLIIAMKKGNRLDVHGTSRKGTYSVDDYSLTGFTGAYEKMKVLCP